jgi:hypothetical protein
MGQMLMEQWEKEFWYIDKKIQMYCEGCFINNKILPKQKKGLMQKVSHFQEL